MKILHYTLIATLLFISFSCKKDTEGVSKVTTYVVLTLQGEHFMTVAKGTTFTDPGYTAKEGETDATVTVTGTVDTNTPGTYKLTYVSLNKQGYSVTDERIVGVYDAAAAANDFSGRYARSTNGSIAVWTKVAPGLYTIFNPGGAPGTNLTIHAFNTTGNTIVAPSQISSDGSVTSLTNSTGGPNITMGAQYKIVVVNPGYGTSVRTFNKQ